MEKSSVLAQKISTINHVQRARMVFIVLAAIRYGQRPEDMVTTRTENEKRTPRPLSPIPLYGKRVQKSVGFGQAGNTTKIVIIEKNDLI